MPSATQTLGLHETLLGPDALPPPPVRHALFACLIALTAIVHLCTAGWSEIHNGLEGEYASGARRMLHAELPLVPFRGDVISPREPPLLPWALAVSYRIFGVTATAARVPIALAMVALVALTFLIGERLSGYWRGFVAGLILLCSCGAFLWGRMVTPEPLFALFAAAAIFCAISGYQGRQRRRAWFVGFWICGALAYLTDGAVAVAFLGAIIVFLALFFREARMRFSALLHWSGVLVFVAVVLSWHLCLRGVAGAQWLLPLDTYAGSAELDHVGSAQFVLSHFGWWFPAVLLVLPGLLLAWRRVVRPAEIDFADALPLCWMAVGLAPLLFFPHRQYVDSLPMWSAFALWAACGWDRVPLGLRIAGIVLAAVGCAFGGIALQARGFHLGMINFGSVEQTLGSTVLLVSTAAALCAFAAGAYLLWRKQETLAIAVLLLGTLPFDLALAERDARLGAQVSFGGLASFLQERLGEDGQMIYEGSAQSGSSLGFYLDRPFFIVDPAAAGVADMHSPGQLSQAEAIDKFDAARPVYLIVHQDRVPIWQERLTQRYHIYHQVSTAGSYVLVNNQP